MRTDQNHEEVLWTLHKGDRIAEARTSSADFVPQLRIYTGSGPKRATYALVSMERVSDAKTLRALAAEKRKEFEVEGWEGR